MKNILFFASFLLVLFITPIKSIAQEKFNADSTKKKSSDEKKSYGLASTNYNNNIVFLGRKSFLVAPYLSTFVGYYHKSGLFINGGASYLAAAGENRFDLFTLSTGYDYYLKNFSAGISATKYFFNTKSYTVKSELSGNVSAYIDYDFDIVDVYIDGSTYFSNTTDFILDAAVSHIFYAVNDNLAIAPTVFLNAGTQNYYSNYNNNLRFGRHMIGGGGSSTMGGSMGGAASFYMLDYELSLLVSYTLNKFRFSFYPVYAIPVNAATIANGPNIYKEDLSNSFFWSLGVSYKFL
ncbi:MAG: hypothetical protein EKK39_02460 [Sphingobacteriales bacterium]|uniref:hypothetical protein n=1 Tax=Hydrotalea flava TaxID=714549 RepID=UPI000FC15CA3|nr:hypothetical protein [Hydrotalea flava]RTL55683.1 MAG: hypothetical protein EKK39_02460 [Sphingobacteriales bacterium]